MKELEKQNLSAGVRYRYGKSVAQVNVKDGVANGLTCDDGEELDADVVILCCAVWTQYVRNVTSNIHMLPLRYGVQSNC